MAEGGEGANGRVTLREVEEGDLPIFFENQLDPQASYMAAFTAKDPSDREAFMAHWGRILADDSTINRTILYNGRVAGYIACFEWEGKREVGYWLGREYWGKGIATGALAKLLRIVTTRPLYAAVAKDNTASTRVLQKCGFVPISSAKSFANARAQEIEETILKLD